jgi:hypothetical protein
VNRERYAFLNLTGAAPARDEYEAGWHYCSEWDGMLVGPGMIETECCSCPAWVNRLSGKSPSAEPVRSEAQEGRDSPDPAL